MNKISPKVETQIAEMESEIEDCFDIVEERMANA
jgi:hypothetical protein